jgi:hypothetical protein
MPGSSHAQLASQATNVNKITFALDAVTAGTKPMPMHPAKNAITALLNAPKLPLESWSTNTPLLVKHDPLELSVHPFLLAINTAYDKHYPVVFSPDMIWLLILQGLASHVNADAEALRKKFVAHDGKLTLLVKRDGFKKGNPGNDWQGVFGEFSAQLRTHIGADTHGLIVNEFSTTGAVEKAAMEVSLMDTLQAYFVYSMSTLPWRVPQATGSSSEPAPKRCEAMISSGGYHICCPSWISSYWPAKTTRIKRSGAISTSSPVAAAGPHEFRGTFSICFHISGRCAQPMRDFSAIWKPTFAAASKADGQKLKS